MAEGAQNHAEEIRRNSDSYKPKAVPETLKVIRGNVEEPKQEEYAVMNNNADNADVYGYCDLRFPVTDMKRSVDFYCNVLGYVLNDPNDPIGNEVYIKFKKDNAPGIFLMLTRPENFKHMHWMQDGKYIEAVEMMTQDLWALYRRLKQAGAETLGEPKFGDFGSLKFFDPDGHCIQAVEERGIYFKLKKKVISGIGRDLSEREDQLLKELCESAGIESQQFVSSVISLMIDK